MTDLPGIGDSIPAGGASGGRAAAGGPADANGLGGLDYQAFLRLLVEQMRHQDPTEPMDGTEYMAQLATFADVEQGLRANDRLEEILMTLSMNQASDLLGRTVSTLDGSISGRVVSYEIYINGVNLVLDDGTKLPFGPGIVISEDDAT